tara:strand:- start:15655 stop:16608 length:954 start_codon:yes stop_codon:yes gene_type:complete
LIKLRLQRKGRKKRPFYHIVVADSRSPRDGRIIERLGRFDNVSENQELTYDEERIIHWLKIGAQPSDTVRSILKKEGILYKMHLERWGKSEEEIQAALDEWRAAREAKTDDKELNKREQQRAQLKAEEQEFKKQLEEKAAAAAKALEKKKEAEAKAEAGEESDEDAEAVEATGEETAEVEAEAKEEETDEAEQPEAEEKTEATAETEEVEAKAETDEAAETAEAKEEAQPEAKAEEKEAVEAEKPVAEEKEEAPEEPKAEAKADEEDAKAGQVSTDMNATEAIDHIKNSSVDELEGFVPKDEERVTVQRAWESKQEE